MKPQPIRRRSSLLRFFKAAGEEFGLKRCEVQGFASGKSPSGLAVRAGWGGALGAHSRLKTIRTKGFPVKSILLK